MNRYVTAPLVIFLCVATSLVGCSKSKDHKPTVEVTGTITYRSRPVEGAKVIFTGPADVPPAVGVTDSEGRFKLTTYDPGDGAVAGDYTVTVVKNIATASGPPANETMEQAAVRAKKKAKKASAGSASALPEKYANPSLSGLQYKVEDGKSNDFTIELKD